MLIRMLIDTVSKGGNLLLNVGPNARGEFQPEALAILQGIGDWMRTHGRSIYGCTESEFSPPVDCRYTQHGNRLYCHLLAWPFRSLHLEGLAERVEYCQFLHDASEVRFKVNDPGAFRSDGPQNVVSLQLPIQKPRVAVPVVEIYLKP